MPVRFTSLFLVIALFMLSASSICAEERHKAIGRISSEAVARVGVSFDPGESRGVFIGVNEYTAPRGVRPPDLSSCVNDAVDLAAMFWDLGLIEPSGMVLAISGKPSKPDSIASFERLQAAGVIITPDARRDTLDFAISKAASEAGGDGILFVTWSAHGFEANGVQYLTPQNFYSMTDQPSVGEIAGRAISESTLSAVAQSSPASRRILLFDACRETRSLSPGAPELIAEAAGMVTLYAVTSGKLAVDGSRNGAFTDKVIEALTSADPPESLRADRNGYITVATLLEHLGTAGRIEDPKILSMPLRKHPRDFAVVEAREKAMEDFTAAKQIDITAPREERMLDSISVGEMEQALSSDEGSRLVAETEALLGEEDSRTNYRNRRSFAAAWRGLAMAKAAQATPIPRLPRSTPSVTDLGLDALLELQAKAEEEWQKLVRMESLPAISSEKKAAYYTTYISTFDSTGHEIEKARERQAHWENVGRPTPTPNRTAAKHKARFVKSDAGVISDSEAGLEWYVGPDQDTTYDEAVKWVQNCAVAGGGWRMPTREELMELYQPGASAKNIPRVFHLGGWWVWAEDEPADEKRAWTGNFNGGDKLLVVRTDGEYARAFAVRSLTN